MEQTLSRHIYIYESEEVQAENRPGGWGVGFRVLGFRVQGVGSRVQVYGVWGLGFGVCGSGSGIRGSGFGG